MRNGQDLQDGLFKTKQGANYGQDYRMAGFKGLRVGAKLGANYGQDGRIYRTKGWGLTGG